jgi:hypothetical protein
MAEQTISSEVQSSSRSAHCDASGCERAATAAIESRALCLQHFISSSQDEIEQRSSRLKGEAYDRGATDSFRKFLAECARQAKQFAEDKATADPQQHARLLDLLLRASDLTARLRRSPRQPASVPVWLRREDPGRTWEEETRTLAISRHGAGFECRHFVETGGTLVVARRDTGRRTQARVAYCRFDSQGQRQIGVEFLDRDDFWGLDINSAQTIASAAFRDASAPASPDTITVAPPAAVAPSGVAAAVVEPAPRKHENGAAAASFSERWIARERGFWRALEINDARQLKKLLADDFVWVSERGLRNRRAVIEAARELCPVGSSREDFEVTQLAPGCVRLTFRSSRVSLTGAEPARVCFHTSLWLERDSKPQLVFHQITPAS